MLTYSSYVAISHLRPVTTTTALRLKFRPEHTNIDTFLRASSPASRSHMEQLRSEVEKMTARIPNSSMKSTLQEKIIQVIQDVVASRYYQEEIIHGPIVGEVIAMAGRKALDGNLTSPHRKSNGVRMQTYSPSTEWPSATQNGSRSRLRLALTSSYIYSSNICGSIHIRTRTSQLCHDQNVGGNTKKEDERVLQTQTVFVWHPAPWLLTWCCSYGLKVEILRKFLQQGWK